MAKRIRRNFDIYIAPDILGTYNENNYPSAIDERTDTVVDPNTISGKILIYERQVKDWFLNRASRLVNGNYNGFIVLMICLSYLEGIEQYYRGQSSNGQSRVSFRASVNRIYPELFSNEQLNELYSEARCGLFHNGMVNGKIIINNQFENPLEFQDQETIKISPKKLLIDLKRDFKNYIAILKNEDQLERRQNFNQMFSNL